MLVQVDGDYHQESLLLEYQPEVEGATGLQAEDCVFTPSREGIAQVVVANRSGFTQVAEEGEKIREASVVGVVEPMDSVFSAQTFMLDSRDATHQVKRKDIHRRKKIRVMFGSTALPEAKKKLLKLLEDYHQAFCLDERERGETDLIEMQIETGDAVPKRQRARRMPLAIRSEVAKQLRKMQDMGVIQQSCSAWASPVVMVRKKDGTHRFCVDYRELNSGSPMLASCSKYSWASKGPDFVSVYIDDVLVFSRSLEEHMDHLAQVIDRLQGAGLKIKPSKCSFMCQEVEYLGHIITPSGRIDLLRLPWSSVKTLS